MTHDELVRLADQNVMPVERVLLPRHSLSLDPTVGLRLTHCAGYAVLPDHEQPISTDNPLPWSVKAVRLAKGHHHPQGLVAPPYDTDDHDEAVKVFSILFVIYPGPVALMDGAIWFLLVVDCEQLARISTW